MALIDIVQNAASRLGLKQPVAVVGSTDLTAQILLSLANQEGDELARYHDWQDMIVQREFFSLNQVEQTGALPDDYDHLAYNVEIWDRTNNLRFTGPTPQRVWQQLQTGVTGGVAGWWRLIGGELNIYPAQAENNTIAFEYISKNWCKSASGTPQAAFEDDTDVAIIPERLITLGVVWRFQQSRGFAQYAESMATYEREKEKAAARDRGTGRITPDETGRHGMPPQPIWNGTVGS